MIEKKDTNHDSSETNSGHRDSKPSYLRLVLVCGGIAVVGLLVASIWWPNLTERTKFFTGNLLNLVIALAVIAQVLIYRKQRDIMAQQRETMERQWQVMDDQSAKMKETFVTANCASVSVHSVELNKAGKTVLVRIENTGNMPAGDIRIFLRLFTFGPPEWHGRGDLANQDTKSASVRVNYGRTKLFKGSLPILLTFFLSDWTDSEFRNIDKGTHSLTLIGYVEYSDGFFTEPIRRTEFVLSYLSELGVWCTETPDFADTVGWEGEDTDQI